MLKEEIRNIKSGKSELRKFGITIGIVLSLLGAALWWRGKDYFTYFLILSSAFVFLGLLLPTLLKPIQKAWMIFAVILGWFMTRVILSILFYFVFTSIGLAGKLFGKQFLDLKIDKSKKSYWIYREHVPFDRKNYERQF